MDKNIIIDGINVSECCFYNNSKCNNPNGMACNCINNAVCYFKELKRLEQENKELKEEKLYRGIDRQFIEDANDRLYFKAERYRSALEEIRVIADDTFKVCDDDCGNARKIKLIIDKINEVLSV